MIKTTNILLEELKDYKNPAMKLKRMVNNKECFQIVKGLYETRSDVPAYLLAESIYGPSYISFEYALSYYGLIPEKVYTVTCATYKKRRKKKYQTSFGNFSYADVPSNVFPLYIKLIKENDYYYRLASKEKALCDTLYNLPTVRNVKELADLLFQDLRIDIDELEKINLNIIFELSKLYGSRNVNKLNTLLRRMFK